MTTFIKAEEQNRGLQTYVNLLNQETDALEERNRQLDDNIASFKTLVSLSETDKQRKLQSMRAQAEGLRKEIMRANDDCEDVQGEFSHLQNKVLRMISLFKKSRFSLAVASSMSYDENTQFNENNVIPYLAELEEYISALITYVAYKRDDPNAAISSVPLDRLPQKEFNKREIAIDAPVETQRDASMMEARTEAEEEDMIIDPRMLHRRFMDLVEKKQLTIVPGGMAKKDN